MAERKETLDKIREIAALMRALRWNAEQRFRLAEKWGMREPSVRKLAARASRIVQDEIESDGETRGVAAAALRKIATDCERFSLEARVGKKPQYQVAVNALRVKLEAVRAIAALCGLNAPQQHEVKHVMEALEREHEEMFSRLERRLPHEVFQQVLAALSGDEDASAVSMAVRAGSETPTRIH
jgi:Glu-tRNA(Gln) amidotransferase subunit E-like FAD-binding protein